MGTMEDIRLQLNSGVSVAQLIKEGYAKSSVSLAARQIKKTQKSTPFKPQDSDELQGLRHRREVVKLQNEITTLEESSDRIPERVTALENELRALRSMTVNAVDTALYNSLVYAGMDSEEAREYADSWVDRNIKGDSQ